MLIYKILRPAEWARFEAAGWLDGSPDDHAAGFIHLSSRQQVAATARRFFADEPELVVLAVDADAVDAGLCWEPSPHSGDPFPHLYAALPRSAVVAVHLVRGATAVDSALPPE